MALPAAARNLDFGGDGQVKPSSDSYRLLSACHDTPASQANGRDFFRMGFGKAQKRGCRIGRTTQIPRRDTTVARPSRIRHTHWRSRLSGKSTGPT